MKKMSTFETLGKGLAMGIFTSGLGLLLSLTLIGTVIGVPLIVVGIFMIVVTPLLLFTAKEITCPSCKAENKMLLVLGNSFTCKTCKNKILIRDNRVSLVTA